MLPVFMLFLIPIGGGIPAGVLLACDHHLSWPVMEVLCFISDVILAFLFEPILKLNSVLGDPNRTMAVVLAAMILVPILVRRAKAAFAKS